MSTATRIAAFLGVLAVVFAAAVVTGQAIDPRHDDRIGQDHGDRHQATGDMPGMAESDDGAALGSTNVAGLAIADGRLRLIPAATTFAPGKTQLFRFRIVDAGHATVHDFETEHTKRMHLIAVRRDLTGYVHTHPFQTSDGSRRVPLRFSDPGVYRVFADFKADGEKTTLGTDVFVAGDFKPRSLPAPATRASADGYEVRLSGHARAGHEGDLRFTVKRAGKVGAVQPYLGADGHLVVLRRGIHDHLPVGGHVPPVPSVQA